MLNAGVEGSYRHREFSGSALFKRSIQIVYVVYVLCAGQQIHLQRGELTGRVGNRKPRLVVEG